METNNSFNQATANMFNSQMDQFAQMNQMLMLREMMERSKPVMPIGCTGYYEKGNYFIAESIKDVIDFNDNVMAKDGVIKDGVMIRFISQRKKEKDEKFSGYKVIFSLAGKCSGEVSVFTKSEDVYKSYFNPGMWRMQKRHVVYTPEFNENGIPLDDSLESIERDYMELQRIGDDGEEWIAADRTVSALNKTLFALKNKFKLYTATIDGEEVKLRNK